MKKGSSSFQMEYDWMKQMMADPSNKTRDFNAFAIGAIGSIVESSADYGEIKAQVALEKIQGILKALNND